MICPQCGFKLDEDMRICPVCGTKVTSGHIKEKNKQKVKKTIKFSLTLVLDLLCLLVSLFIMFFGAVGISEGDLFFGISIILFGLSLNPYLYKKTSHKFLIVLMPIIMFVFAFVVALITL